MTPVWPDLIRGRENCHSLVLVAAVVIALVGISLDHWHSRRRFTTSHCTVPDMPAVVVADEVESIAGSLTPLPLYVRASIRTISGITWTDRLCGVYWRKNYDKISSIDSSVSPSSARTLLECFHKSGGTRPRARVHPARSGSLNTQVDDTTSSSRSTRSRWRSTNRSPFRTMLRRRDIACSSGRLSGQWSPRQRSARIHHSHQPGDRRQR